ncbi:MAG: MSCRAMM family protein [Candidatus Fimenecus sp.]
MISGTGKVDPPSYNLKFETDHGTMKIIKKSESGNLSGWEFKITGKGINKTVKTGKDGIISVDLPVQEYTVEEINLPSYMKNPAPQKITVKYHQTASVSFENKYKEGEVQVVKVDKETNKPIETTDAVFEAMTKDSDGKWQSLGNLKYNPTLKLYETGNIKITEHNGGTVRIFERKAPTGYVKNTNDFFDAKLTKDGEVQKITFANNKNEGGLKIIKKSDSGNIKDIEFKITGNNINKTVKTNAQGEITEKLSPGEYTVEELNVPWYFTKPATQKVKIEYGKTAVLNFNNKFKKINITVLKLDGETKKPITASDAVFEVSEKIKGTEKWQKIGVMTYKDGKYILNGISITNKNDGVIKVAETKAPTGYIKSDKEYILDLKEKPFADGQTFEIGKTDSTLTGVPNIPQKGKIRIVKTGEVFSSVEITENSDGQKVYKPVFTEKPLKDAVFGIYAKEDIYLNGELKHKKDAEIARITTDENGTAEQDNLYLGKMYIKEIKAPDGYILNAEPKEIELTYNGEAKEIVSNISFSNKRQKFEISLLKEMEKDKEANLGSNGEILNVIFGLYAAEEFTAADGKIIPKDALIETGSPDKNGTLKFTADLPQGKVYVKEISTDKAYILDGKAYNITLKYEGHIIKVIPVFANDKKPIFNRLKSGTLEITKKDISDGKLLPDTGFRIYDENGKVVSEGRTDKNGIAKFSLRYGKYTYQEFDAPKGYLIDEKEYPFEITEDGQIVKAEMKNKKIPENPKPVIPKTGKLEKSAKVQISVYLSVGVLSAAAVLVFYLRKKKDEG